MALSINFRRFKDPALITYRCLSNVATTTSYPYVPPPSPKRRFSNDKEKPVQNKVAIVTGGARGIGYHISEYLLKAGAQAVILGDILVSDLEEATCKLNDKYGENKALFQPCDVTKKEDMEKIFKCTKERFGKLDIVVNNAGVAETDWKKIIDVNINGLVLGTLLGFQYMGAHCGGEGGHIINVASILGLQPLFSMPVYCGTKWFVVGFTKSMGSDYFNNMTKVKVMAVCPGVTDTEIIKIAGTATLPSFAELDQEAGKSLGALPPQGPEEVGRSVIEMIEDGENGGVWVSEGKETYKTIMPDRSTYKPPPPPKNELKCDDKKKRECKSKEDQCKDEESKEAAKDKSGDTSKKASKSKSKEDNCKSKEDPGKGKGNEKEASSKDKDKCKDDKNSGKGKDDKNSGKGKGKGDKKDKDSCEKPKNKDKCNEKKKC